MSMKCCGLNFLSKSNSDLDLKEDFNDLKRKYEKKLKNDFDNFAKDFQHLPNEVNFPKTSALDKSENASLANRNSIRSFREIEAQELRRGEIILKKNLVSTDSFSELERLERAKNDRLLRQIKSDSDISVKSFREVEARTKGQPMPRKNAFDDTSVNSFSQIEAREKDRNKSFLKKYKTMSQNDNSIHSFSEIEARNDERCESILRKRVMNCAYDDGSIKSFSEIEAIDQKGPDSFQKKRAPISKSDTDASIRSFSEIEARERARKSKKSQDDQVSVYSFSEIEASERDKTEFLLRKKDVKDPYDPYEAESNNSFSEIDAKEREKNNALLKKNFLTDKNARDYTSNEDINSKGSKIKHDHDATSFKSFGEVESAERDFDQMKISNKNETDEISVCSFIELEMRERRREEALMRMKMLQDIKSKPQYENISVKSFGELPNTSLLIERSDPIGCDEMPKPMCGGRDDCCNSTCLISAKFGPKELKQFLGQDINVIRRKKKPFEDRYFLKTISSIVENKQSQLYLSLKARLGATKPSDLMTLIKWKKIEVIFAHKILRKYRKQSIFIISEAK